MFARTKEEIALLWAETTIFEDPMPINRHYEHNLRTIAKAFAQDVKEALN
ncbi:MAG: hypothetical protein IKS64_04010 [Muribaculaceae bacterium]|nr:hypothetical protein [Muribaculaceae bacterium]